MKLKYTYDIEIHDLKNNYIKTLESGMSGGKLKKFKATDYFQYYKNNRKFVIFKNTLGSTVRRRKHKEFSFLNDVKHVFTWDLIYSGGIDEEHDYESDCEEYGCNNDFCCRCSKIVDARIINFDPVEVINFLVNKISKTINFNKVTISENIFKYCLDRIFNANGFYDEHSYEVVINPGYYGEEIGGIQAHCGDKTIEEIMSLLRLSDINAIKFVLNKEYGHVLENVDNCKTANVVWANIKDIVISNENYSRKLDKDIIKVYEKYPYPIGVYRKSGGKYLITDGYHRYSAFKNTGYEENNIIVVE